MQIAFEFNHRKALQVVAYFLRRSTCAMDKAKLMKLVYLADRASFIAHGLPITGDKQFAMKLGPVPSNTLDLIDGDYYKLNERVYQHIQLNNHLVSLLNDPGQGELSPDEMSILDSVWDEHGHKETFSLCRETHRLPEYAETYREGTATLIPYEKIAQHSGNLARFRLGRAVISPQMAASMRSPFPADTSL